jgi:hypothetical protein
LLHCVEHLYAASGFHVFFKYIVFLLLTILGERRLLHTNSKRELAGFIQRGAAMSKASWHTTLNASGRMMAHGMKSVKLFGYFIYSPQRSLL